MIISTDGPVTIFGLSNPSVMSPFISHSTVASCSSAWFTPHDGLICDLYVLSSAAAACQSSADLLERFSARSFLISMQGHMAVSEVEFYFSCSWCVSNGAPLCPRLELEYSALVIS